MQLKRTDTKWLIYHVVASQPEGAIGDKNNPSGPQVIPVIGSGIEQLVGTQLSPQALSQQLLTMVKDGLFSTKVVGRRRYFLALRGRVPKEYQTWLETRLPEVIKPAEPEIVDEVLAEPVVIPEAPQSPLEALLDPLAEAVVKRLAEAILVGLTPPSIEAPETDQIVLGRLSDTLKENERLRRKANDQAELERKMRDELRSAYNRNTSLQRRITELEKSVQTLSEERIVIESGYEELKRIMETPPK